LNERVARWHAVLTLALMIVIFGGMLLAGVSGMPRRLYDPRAYSYLRSTASLTTGISHAAFALFAVQLVYIANFVWALWRGPKSRDNPWQAATLEWLSNNENVGTVIRGPHEYSNPKFGPDSDYAMQSELISQRSELLGEADRRRPEKSAIGAVIVGIASSMVASTLVFTLIALRSRDVTFERPPVTCALIVTPLLVVVSGLMGGVSRTRRATQTVARATALLGLICAAFESYVGHVLFHGARRTTLEALFALLFGWHAANVAGASLLTWVGVQRLESRWPAASIVWSYVALSWIAIASVLWIL
jgi:hypothetical protein